MQEKSDKIRYLIVNNFNEAFIGKALIIAFIILKLTNTVDWSWWWILVPFVLF